MVIRYTSCGGIHQRALGTSGYCDCLSARPRAVARWIHEEASDEEATADEAGSRRAILAEVDIELLVTDDEWSPYLSVQDAYKLDDVRDALKKGDTTTAARYGRLFSLTPIAV